MIVRDRTEDVEEMFPAIPLSRWEEEEKRRRDNAFRASVLAAAQSLLSPNSKQTLSAGVQRNGQ